MDLEIVRRAVRDRSARATVTPHASNAVEADQSWRPDRQDPRFALEREALKAALQGQAPSWTSMESGTFAQPAYAAIHQAMLAVIDRPAFDEAVLEQCVDDRLRSVVTELLVEPLLADADALVRYGESVIARVREQAIGRTLADVKSRLQRVDASEDPDTYHALFAQLMTLEAERRDLREQAVGELG
jgi:DNA primase